MELGLFNGNLYRLADTRDKELFLMSRNDINGFMKVPDYYDYKGDLITNLFERKINENDLEDAYELWHDVIYKGERFELVNYVETLLDGEPVTIATSDAAKAKKFGLPRVDHGVYEKEIPISDIEAIIEIKEPLYQFEKTKQTTTRTIPKDEIMDYAKYIASFA